MTTSELLLKLKELGVRLWVDGEKLRFDAPTGAITAELRDVMVAHKADIIELLKKQAGTVQSGSIPRAERNGNLPLSFAQQRLWILERIEGDLAAYNMSSGFELKGALNTEALRQALETIIERHESLRTTFSMIKDEPVQVIHPNSRFELSIEDLSTYEPEEQETELVRRSQLEAERVFDLTADRMLRARLLKFSEEKHVLLLTMHHIASDGWSRGILLNELHCLYDAYSSGKDAELPELPVQYIDYAVWQRSMLSGKRLEQLLKYWRERLEGLAVLSLPTDHPRPAVLTYEGSRYDFELSSGMSEKLRLLCQETGATMNMLLLAAFQTLLVRYSGQDDIATGTPIAGRNKKDLEHQIGFFVNTLVIRTDFSNDPTFYELLERVREVSLGAYDHGEVPFEKLVEELQPDRHPNLNPFFQVFFQVFHFSNELKLSGLEVIQLPPSGKRVHFDLEMTLREDPNRILGMFRYSTELFERASIERMIGHFLILLEGVVANPDQKISELPLLTASECQHLLKDWNDTAMDYPSDKCIHELFELQAEKTPDAIAAVFEEEALTYRQLNERANQLAHHLIRLGVESETLVGLCLERSMDLIVGILGILKAGGAYVPLDISHPPQRLEFILEDAQVNYLLTHPELREQLPASIEHTILLTAENEAIANGPKENPPCRAKPDQLAYTMYTSGSTGQPKGVQIPHGAVVNFLTSMAVEPGLTAKDRLLSVTTPTFDISVLELLLPIVIGASVDIVSSELSSDAMGLANRLIQTGATVMQATPATWQMLIQAGWEGASNLKVLCGGEALSDKLATELLPRCGELWNMYGPTETTIWSTCLLVSDGGPHGSIDRPIANTQTYLLDQNQQLVPVGIPGELYIGGVGLARGYFNRPDLTAEKFISHIFEDGTSERLYRTGDLCKRHEDGTLEFLGRIDHQVKVRGFRIELGEIEAVLDEYPEISQSVVIVHEGKSGDHRLVAYLKPATDTKPKVSELKSHLGSKLPDYMIPAMYVTLDSFPLNPNGKVDRRALPAPDTSRLELENQYVPPREGLEEQLVSIWREVLLVDKIGIHDNFFDLGGHSLSSVQLVNKIRQSLSKTVRIVDIFQNPTIEKLAHFMTANMESAKSRVQKPLDSDPLKLSFFEIFKDAAKETSDKKSNKMSNKIKNFFLIDDNPLAGIKNRLLQMIARAAPGKFRTRLHRWRGVRISKFAWIGYDCIIETAYPWLVSIGDYSRISMRTTIIAHFAEAESGIESREKPSVCIEDNVWIGPNVTILPNVTIGSGSVVAAGSVVNQSVSPKTLVQGNPAVPKARCGLPFSQKVTYEAFVRNLEPIQVNSDHSS